VLSARDGATATLDLWWGPVTPPVPSGTGAWRASAALAAAALAVPPALVVAVRRGGWAVGVVADGRERAGKAGRRYVQSRTSKGGSSQGRYARRRDNQAAALVDDAVQRVRLVLDDPIAMSAVTLVATAGDRLLSAEVLARAGVDLPKIGPFEVGDPRRATLTEVAERLRGVRVQVTGTSVTPRGRPTA
jgi:hypothetical protein